MAKITIIGLHYSPERSGNAPYTTSLARRLASSGHTVRVITGFPHYPEWQRHEGYSGWQKTEIIDGVYVKRLQHYVPQKPSGARRILMEFTFGLHVLAANWGKPDIVVLVSPALISTGLASLRAHLTRKKIPFLIWVQDLYSRGIVETNMATGPVARLALRMESAVLGSANGVVTIHERFRTYMAGSLGLAQQEIRVIRNWTHLPDAPRSGQEPFRKKVGWKDDDVIVLHAGNMGKKQGLENVIAAARIAEAKNSRVRFVLMGDGNQRPALELAAAGIRNVTFLDSLPDEEYQAALTAADALLVNELPGVKDMSVPSKLTSYFNAGVPVIAATDPSSVTAQEIAAANGGLRVDADDAGALVEAAERLSQDKSLARTLGANGLKFREVTLSEDVAIAKYDDFIHSFTSSRRR